MHAFPLHALAKGVAQPLTGSEQACADSRRIQPESLSDLLLRIAVQHLQHERLAVLSGQRAQCPTQHEGLGARVIASASLRDGLRRRVGLLQARAGETPRVLAPDDRVEPGLRGRRTLELLERAPGPQQALLDQVLGGMPSAPITLAGEYATGLGILAFRPERAALCVCWLDESFRLRAERQGWHALDEGVESLPGVLQPLAGMRFQTRRIAGREVLLARRAGRETRFGEKVSPLPDLNPSWQARLGAYETLNADPGFPVRETELLAQHGHLCLAYRLPRLSRARIHLPLRAVSPAEAMVLGLGRTPGETVRMIQVGGGERLRFSGWIARPVAPA